MGDPSGPETRRAGWTYAVLRAMVCAFPVGTLLLVLLFQTSETYAGVSMVSVLPFALASFASLTAIYALCLLVVSDSLARRCRLREIEVTHAVRRERELVREKGDLTHEIELLSATREVMLILNQDVEFESILGKVLEIAANLIAGKGGEEITIYMVGEDSRVHPRAHRKGAKTLFGKDLERLALDRTNVEETVEHRRPHAVAEGTRISLVFPLFADRELLGAMKVRVELDPEHEDRGVRMERLEQHLLEFSRIVSLAIKTPDLYTRTIEDGMTRLFTKRHFGNQIRTYFAIARRYQEPLTLVMVDVDHFKKVNDGYGHLTGDAVLKGVAEIVREGIRSYSTAYRYGGEELAILMPKTPAPQAITVAERLRKRVEARKFTAEDRRSLAVTASFGIAEFDPAMTSPDELISRADEALYRAKDLGRNRICLHGHDSLPPPMPDDTVRMFRPKPEPKPEAMPAARG